MKTILSSRRHHYVARASAFLIVVALIAAGIVACDGDGDGGGEVEPLDHFKWYMADSTESIDEVVYLKDQFCAVEATVGYVVGFGNPAEKVHGAVTTPISNPDHHLTGYEIYYEEEPQEWLVEVKNQFGTQELTVWGPYGLAVPTQKEGHQSPVGLDHYMVYTVTDGPSVDVSVSLQDQFDGEPQESSVGLPMYFANPVIKTHGLEVTEILDPETHLVFYYIDADFEGEVEVVNQFGEQTLDVYTFFETGGLAVPSEKIDWEKLADIPEEPSELVIGTARDTDEYLEFFEWACAGPLMREFVEQVNLAGGVHLSAYDTPTEECWVDLVIDRREVNLGEAGHIEEVTQGICDDIAAGDVHFLWGGPSTEFILAQAPIANDNEVVLLALEGGGEFIRNDLDKLPSWPYVFIPLSYSDWYQLPVLADILEDKLEVGDGEVRAYVVYIDEAHGYEYLGVANDYFDVVADAGVPIVFDPSGADAVVDAAMTALNISGNNDDYDIFCCFAYPWHVNPITNAAMTLGFNPPAMVFGPGANFGYYPYLYGDPPGPCPDESRDPSLVDGILAFTVAAYDTNSEIQDVYDWIAERMDDDLNDPISGFPGCPDFPGSLIQDYWGTPPYWAGLETWLAAVEEVGYVDQDELKNVLASKNAGNPFETILGDTWYTMSGGGGGSLDYLCHTGEIGQWQSGDFETVGPVDAGQPVPGLPNYVVTANFMFPMTDDWNWLP